jgi:hypothetical protein
MKFRDQLYTVVLLGSLALAACAENGPTSPAPGGVAFSAGKSKASVCHVTGDGSINLISVASSAVPAHQAHGDLVVGAPLPGNTGVIGQDCTPVRFVLLAGTTYDTPIHGVATAASFEDECPAGYVGVGLTGVAGSWFGGATHWSVALQCRELLADGTLGALVTLSPHGSGANAVPVTSYGASCPSGQVLAGLSGRWSPFGVSSITGGCSTVTRIASGSTGYDSTIGPFDGTGGGSQTAFAEACAPGYAVTGIIGRYGAILDAIGFRCTKVVQQAV